MGIYSNWEEESYREEYMKEEATRIRLEIAEDEAIKVVGEPKNWKELEDLFKPCVKEDLCGHCSLCCQEEQGYKP